MLLLLLACATHHSPSAAPLTSATDTFRYDAASGRCLDGAGKEGRNTVTIAAVRESRDGECADLRGLELLPPSTGTLEGWNLSGADLTGATLHFSAIVDADLRGANLAAFDYGYVTIDGKVDAFTRLRPGCEPADGRVACGR